jgi:hypothetical protein
MGYEGEDEVSSTRTPGRLYVLAGFRGDVVVIAVPTEQGEAMKRRGHPHVYISSAQAYAVRAKLLDAKPCADGSKLC